MTKLSHIFYPLTKIFAMWCANTVPMYYVVTQKVPGPSCNSTHHVNYLITMRS